jgi:hypothetical protein
MTNLKKEYAQYIDIPNWRSLQSQIIEFRKKNFPTNGWVWYCYFEDQVKEEIPELLETFEKMGLKMRQMILFDNLPNDLTIKDHDDPLSVFIHTDSEDKEDTVGIPHPPEVEFSTDFKPTYALNIPLENCEESLTMWYEFIRDNDRDCYYPHVDCGGHKHDAVREVFRFELNKPAVIDVSVPHGVYNPHKERRTVATFRFYNDINYLFN